MKSSAGIFGPLLLVAVAANSAPAGASEPTPSLTERYREPAGRILGAAMTDVAAWERLEHLTTVIGHRLSGSPQLEQAIDWIVAEMTKAGLDNPHRQPVQVPHWVRGDEQARLLAPVERPLAILGLGGSVATPPGGLRAPVVVVESFAELEALGRDRVAGRIVLYAVPWEGYGRTVRYRSSGASRAAELGAVAALVRSATGRSLYTPHTGGMSYAEGAPKIPAAAVTVEDATWIKRLSERGERVEIELDMQARILPDAESANVIAELVGSELPHEVVVIGGHLDSWDVGQGAHDDGAACIAAWRALEILKELGLRPRRTLRVVLFTNEENGLQGARTYREELGERVSDHVAAIEMDGGAERPIGFGFGPRTSPGSESDPKLEAASARLREIGALLDGIGAGQIVPGGGGADIGPLMRAGVPGLALRTVGEHYFDWHHTAADTLDKVDPQNLRMAVALFAVMGYVLADMPDRL